MTPDEREARLALILRQELLAVATAQMVAEDLIRKCADVLPEFESRTALTVAATAALLSGYPATSVGRALLVVSDHCVPFDRETGLGGEVSDYVQGLVSALSAVAYSPGPASDFAGWANAFCEVLTRKFFAAELIWPAVAQENARRSAQALVVRASAPSVWKADTMAALVEEVMTLLPRGLDEGAVRAAVAVVASPGGQADLLPLSALREQVRFVAESNDRWLAVHDQPAGAPR